jgi:hypothetical protein
MARDSTVNAYLKLDLIFFVPIASRKEFNQSPNEKLYFNDLSMFIKKMK